MTKFKEYKHNIVLNDGRIVTRKFIILQYANGSFKFTDFHRYINNPRRSTHNINEGGVSRYAFIIPFLNYVFFSVGLEKLDNLTPDMVQEYLVEYSIGDLQTDNENVSHNTRTIERGMGYIFDFLEVYKREQKRKFKMNLDDLYIWVDFRDKHGRVQKKKVPAFKVYENNKVNSIFRDIPNVAFDMLFSHIAKNHTDILGLIMLSSFAGLRPSEACNVRRIDSPLGPGLLFEHAEDWNNRYIDRIYIDIRKELNLRHDLKPVGFIKKERKQEVPDIFLSAFRDAYNIYMCYMEGRKYDSNFAPFSVNSRGKAMTYASYRQKFQKIIKEEMIPIYLKSDNPEIVLYGRLLMEHNLSPHVFRHWYTVQLVLSGITDLGTLMYFRGDTSPTSALTYLQDKGELERQYIKVNNEVFDYLKWRTYNND